MIFFTTLLDTPCSKIIRMEMGENEAVLEYQAEKLANRMAKSLEVGVGLDDARTRINEIGKLGSYETGFKYMLGKTIGEYSTGSATSVSVKVGGSMYERMKETWRYFGHPFSELPRNVDAYKESSKRVVEKGDQFMAWFKDNFNIAEENDVYLSPTGTHSFRLIRAIVGGDKVAIISTPEMGTSARDAMEGKTFSGYNLKGEKIEEGDLQGIELAKIIDVPIRDREGSPVVGINKWYIERLKEHLEDGVDRETLIMNFALPGKGGSQPKELYEMAKSMTFIAKAINGIEIDGINWGNEGNTGSGKTARLGRLEKLSEQDEGVKKVVAQVGGSEGVNKFAEIERMVTVADVAQWRVRQEYEGKDLIEEGVALVACFTGSKKMMGASFSGIIESDPWVLQQARETSSEGIPAGFAADAIGVGHFRTGTKLKIGGKEVEMNNYSGQIGNVDVGLITKLDGIRPHMDEYFAIPLEERKQIVEEVNALVRTAIYKWGSDLDMRNMAGRIYRRWSIKLDLDSNEDTPTTFSMQVINNSAERKNNPLDFKKIRRLMMAELPVPKRHGKAIGESDWPSWMPEDFNFVQESLLNQFELPNPYAEKVFAKKDLQKSKTHKENFRVAIGVKNEVLYHNEPEKIEQMFKQEFAKLAMIIEFWDDFYSTYKI